MSEVSPRAATLRSTAVAAQGVPYWPLRLRVLAWSAPATLGVAYASTIAIQRGERAQLWQFAATSLVTWYSWVAFSPLVERLADRWPLWSGSWGPSTTATVRAFAQATTQAPTPITLSATTGRVALHLLAAMLCTLLQASATAVAAVAVGAGRWSQFGDMAIAWFVTLMPAGVVVYAAVLAFRHTTVQRTLLAQHQRQAEQLALELRDTQLTALRGQLQPHFLFNTLAAITALVRDRETDRATAALGQLSTVLRSALRDGDRHETPLSEELDRIREYLRIEELRLGAEIAVTVQLDALAARALVPTWILQPLVENSVRHGFRKRTGGGALMVLASVEASTASPRDDVPERWLTLSVTDNGGGLRTDWERRATVGYGLSNSRARLRALHGEAASMTVATVSADAMPAAHSTTLPTTDGTEDTVGTCITLRLPFRVEATAS